MGFCDDPKYSRFWEWANTKLSNEINPVVKNILAFNNLANFTNLKQLINDEDVMTIETLQLSGRSREYQTAAADFIKKGEDKKNFFGYALPDPDNDALFPDFVLNPGNRSEYKRLLSEIKKTSERQYKSKIRSNIAPPPDDENDVADVQAISEAVEGHKLYPANLKEFIVAKNMDIDITERHTAQATCPFPDCHKVFILRKRLQRQSWLWRIDNFTKHFIKHKPQE